jgi:hypothetical protein
MKNKNKLNDYLYALHDTMIGFDIVTDYAIIYDNERKKQFKKYKKKLKKMCRKIHKKCERKMYS